MITQDLISWYGSGESIQYDVVNVDGGPAGLSTAHTTTMPWVKRYTPEFVRRRDRFAMPAGESWRVDETCVKIRGRWGCLHRTRKTVDFLLRAKLDVKAAKVFCCKATKHQSQPPKTITLDGCAASRRAVREVKVAGLLPEDTRVRSSKYLSNVLQQDHRIKSQTSAMHGFKRFRYAAVTIAGIELAL